MTSSGAEYHVFYKKKNSISDFDDVVAPFG